MSITLNSNKNVLTEQYKWIDLLQRMKNVTNKAKRLEDDIQFQKRANESLISRVNCILNELEKSTNNVHRQLNETRQESNELIDKHRQINTKYESIV